MAEAPQVYVVYYRNWAPAVSATNPSIQINLATTKPVILHEIHISNNNSTASGAMEFDLGYGTSTATGTLTQTNVNYAKYNPSDATPGFALKDGGFTSATGGLVVMMRRAFNTLNGFEWIPVPEYRPVFRAADGFISFRWLAVPASTNVDLELMVQEVG